MTLHPLFAALSAMFATLFVSACQPAPAIPLNLIENGRPALWQVTDPKSTSSGYLFGSIHALPPDLDWQTPALDAAIKDSNYLVTEISRDLNDADGAFLRKTAADEPVTPLKSRLSPPLFARAMALAADLDMTEAQIDRTESWALSLFLVPNLANRFGLEKESGVEAVLSRRFSSAAWGRKGLEEPRDQFMRFDNMSEQDQNLLLQITLDQNGGTTLVEQQINAWMKGDLATLESLNKRGFMAHASLNNALLLQPNRLWSYKIASQLRTGQKPFIVVGAAHLIGDGNLLELLAAQGFKIQRIQ